MWQRLLCCASASRRAIGVPRQAGKVTAAGCPAAVPAGRPAATPSCMRQTLLFWLLLQELTDISDAIKRHEGCNIYGWLQVRG